LLTEIPQTFDSVALVSAAVSQLRAGLMLRLETGLGWLIQQLPSSARLTQNETPRSFDVRVRSQFETRAESTSMRGKKASSPSRRLRLAVQTPATSSPSAHAEELMELAVDARPVPHLPEFLSRFAERSARMLNAAWGGVAVFRSRETELYSAPESSRTHVQRGKDWLITQARAIHGEIVTLRLPADNSADLSDDADLASAIFVPIAASDGERLGVLCLLRTAKTIGADDCAATACAGESRRALPGKFQAVFAIRAFQASVGGRY